MLNLENDLIKIKLVTRGAELQSIFHKKNGIEYMWGGDPAIWGKHSPVLFPIVGTLKNNSFLYQGKSYQLPRHGFAREMDFIVEKQSSSEIIFLLSSNTETKKNYPFDFEFRIRYRLQADELSTEYMITNTGTDLLLFSVGGHPAFRLPLTADTSYSDYYLEFEEKEKLSRWPISKDGLILPDPIPVLQNSNRLPLNKSLFDQDALVFKYPVSSEISLLSNKTSHGIQFHMGEFPFLGIWAAKNADFICLEPWCGIADAVNSNQKLEEKEGIEKSAPGKTFSRQWRVKVF